MSLGVSHPHRRTTRRGAVIALWLASSFAAAPPAAADDPLDSLSGRQIYERVLANRFDAFLQHAELTSGDRAGHQQATRFDLWYQEFRELLTSEDGENGLLSKTLIRYTHPFDLRHTAYLVVNNRGAPNDQFLYLASERRVKRINLRGEAVFGSDFSFEDVLPREIEDASYERLADTVEGGAPCFQIRATPLPEKRSEYSHFVVLIEKQRFVPLLTRYWETRGVEVKQLRVARERIEKHDEVWVPMQMTMTHLQHESYTRLQVRSIEPRERLDRDDFDLRRLESH
jgi:hypothetical protein